VQYKLQNYQKLTINLNYYNSLLHPLKMDPFISDEQCEI